MSNAGMHFLGSCDADSVFTVTPVSSEAAHDPQTVRRQARVFLLSPANCNGRRAKQILSSRAAFPLAERLRSRHGAPLGELFAFVSGLYFRGKLTYARRFAAPPDPSNALVGCGVHVITPNAGLRDPDTLVTSTPVRAFAGADVHPDNAACRNPPDRSARSLATPIGPECHVVL